MRKGHAVVLGGGFAGLVTAGALTEFYQRVTVVDRDPAPAPGAYRRGAPQGKHAHNLLPGGARALEEIFPGILGEMADDGGVRADMLVGYRFHFAGVEVPQVSIGASGIQATRPFYEDHLRRRLAHDVRLLLGSEIAGLVTDQARGRVTGVRIRSDGREETLAADLVVDAMGRGARTPVWLEQLGYQAPPEDRVQVDVAYASRIIRFTPQDAARAGLLVGGDINGTPRGVLLVAIEGDRHILTLTGIGPDHRPPTDEPGFAEFLATAAPADIVESVAAAETLGEIAQHRFPTATWRHYERLNRFPDGLLVIGDALCGLNPIYGQGLTVAAQEAVALRDCLARGYDDVARRFFAAAARIVTGPWQMVADADPSKSSRTTAERLRAELMNRMTVAATRDETVAVRLARVMALLDPPTTLMRPGVLWRALRRGAPAARRSTQPTLASASNARTTGNDTTTWADSTIPEADDSCHLHR